MLSSAKFAKEHKLPQEHIAPDEEAAVTALLVAAVRQLPRTSPTCFG